ncbi:MAG: ArnT family glycosyltransferase [bacterium]
MSAEAPRAPRDSSARNRALLIGVLLFIASAAYFASYARIGLYDDEGYLLEGVTRLLDGQVIYRDFHHTYAPGRFYMFAALFKLFGEDLLVVRAAWVVMRAGIVVLAWLFARRLVGGAYAWIAPLGLLAAPGPWHKSFFHLFLVGAALAASALFSRGGRRASFWTGALVATAILFRQDVGVAAAGAIGLYWLIRRAPDVPRVSAPLLLAGFAAVLAAPLAYFISQNALGPLLVKVFVAGVRDNRTNELPFPPLLPLIPSGAPDARAVFSLLFVKVLYYVPPVSFALYGATLAATALRNRALPQPAPFFLLLLGAAGFSQVLARSDLPHLLQAIGLVYFVWAIAVASAARALPKQFSLAVAALAAVLVPATLTLGFFWLARSSATPAGATYLTSAGVMMTAENATGAFVSLPRVERTRLELPRARVDVPPALAAIVGEAGSFIEEHTAPGDYFLTLPGYQLLYFLFDRRNPTHFPHVRRAFESRDEEDRYMADIEDHQTRYIFFQEIAIDGRPERRFAVYAERTMNWIVERYRPVKQIGEPRAGLSFVVLERLAEPR